MLSFPDAEAELNIQVNNVDKTSKAGELNSILDTQNNTFFFYMHLI